MLLDSLHHTGNDAIDNRSSYSAEWSSSQRRIAQVRLTSFSLVYSRLGEHFVYVLTQHGIGCLKVGDL